MLLQGNRELLRFDRNAADCIVNSLSLQIPRVIAGSARLPPRREYCTRDPIAFPSLPSRSVGPDNPRRATIAYVLLWVGQTKK
jgi:hypothetical protein